MVSEYYYREGRFRCKLSDNAAAPIALLAPFEFKGFYSPSTVASAMAKGAKLAGFHPIECAGSGGGGGFGDSLSSLPGFTRIKRMARDPHSRRRQCVFLFN